MTAHRGALLSARPERGASVYAASFIRKRQIVLETGLLRDPETFRLILVHEIFHFVWARLGNARRRQFAELLANERGAGARGGLGESSMVKRDRFLMHNLRVWRDYVCESFCDTAAWMYAGIGQNDAFTLACRWRERRRAWFEGVFATCRNC